MWPCDAIECGPHQKIADYCSPVVGFLSGRSNCANSSAALVADVVESVNKYHDQHRRATLQIITVDCAVPTGFFVGPRN